jgi:hypothetical protein
MNIERPRWAVNGTITKQPLSAVLYRVYGPARQLPSDVLCLLDRLESRSSYRDA